MRTPSRGIVVTIISLACFVVATNGATDRIYSKAVEQAHCESGQTTDFSTYAGAANSCLEDLANQAGQETTNMATAGQNDNIIYCAAACEHSLSPAECRKCVQSAIAIRDKYCPATLNASVVLTSCGLIHSTAELNNDAIMSSNPKLVRFLADIDASNMNRADNKVPHIHSEMRNANTNSQEVDAQINQADSQLPNMNAEIDNTNACRPKTNAETDKVNSNANNAAMENASLPGINQELNANEDANTNANTNEIEIANADAGLPEKRNAEMHGLIANANENANANPLTPEENKAEMHGFNANANANEKAGASANGNVNANAHLPNDVIADMHNAIAHGLKANSNNGANATDAKY